jgi:glycosyltransferase involved in cell wall biosynthesis
MTEPFRFPEKLVIVTHVVHYRRREHVYAYAPYAREIEIWASIFDGIVIAAPCRDAEPPSDCDLLNFRNLQVIPQREIGGETWIAKAKLICSLPMMIWDLCGAMRQGDAIQVRCPGNTALLGSILGPLFSRHLVAKFAGQWNSNHNDGLSIRVQRAVLRSKWWGAPVTVYGHGHNEPEHVIPFFNSVLTDAQISHASVAGAKRGANELRHILFVGRLSRSKNVDVLLRSLGQLHLEGFHFTASIVGEGPECDRLIALCADLGLSDRVKFLGGMSFDQVVELLERSGILVLVSETEGWPKAIVEAMAFGLVAIGSEVGIVPQILGEGRGLVVPSRDTTALTRVLGRVLAAPEEFSAMRSLAAAFGRRYSTELLRDSLCSLLSDRWGLPPVAPKDSHSGPVICTHTGMRVSSDQ